MNFLGLYYYWRLWEEEDTYIAGIVLVLLFLLVIFNRFKSFLANGAFLGCVVGCLRALTSNKIIYGQKIGFVEGGILYGLLLGCLAKIIFSFLKKSQPNQLQSVTTTTRIEIAHSPLFWVSLLGISGISVGLTLAAFFGMTDKEMVFWMVGLLFAGCVLGITVGPISKKFFWFRAFLELGISIALTTGIGTIVGWRMVLPFLMFDVNPPVSTEVLFRWTTYSCSAAGAAIGLTAWAVKTFRGKRDRSSQRLQSDGEPSPVSGNRETGKTPTDVRGC